ncbi:chemotaxis protein CheB [Kribbella sp. NPDC056861]|uniref:chemotaxis protein CheB n=1 Tax=Kribbella sp. NPDC056861 TaxID=3154857 RepID=UPI003420ED8D
MGPPGTPRDLVVIGASAGGVEALRNLVSVLPADLPAGVLIVLHLPAGATSMLAGILTAAGRLPATVAEHGAQIEAGHLYVAPPDRHLLIDDSGLVLSDRPAENGHRPGIDALFRSAALTGGPRVVGIILSGVLDDGTAGLVAIKARGGLAIVQDPEDAAYRGMPDSALANVGVDQVLPAVMIGRQLAGILVQSTGLICPDCGKASGRPRPDPAGPGSPAQFELADSDLQAALWAAVRALDEKAALARRMAASAATRGTRKLTQRYLESAEEAGQAAELLRARLTVAQPAEVAPETGGSG